MISFIEILEIPSINRYEVGVFDLDDNFEELELMSNLDKENGNFYFNKFVKKYLISDKKVEKRIPKRYLQFAEDYFEIYNMCRDYFLSLNINNDEGTSNLDYLKVFIGKRLNRGFLREALKEKGLLADISNDWILLGVPLTQYQGFYRTEQCKYMEKLFQNKGYITDMHYCID